MNPTAAGSALSRVTTHQRGRPHSGQTSHHLFPEHPEPNGPSAEPPVNITGKAACRNARRASDGKPSGYCPGRRLHTDPANANHRFTIAYRNRNQRTGTPFTNARHTSTEFFLTLPSHVSRGAVGPLARASQETSPLRTACANMFSSTHPESTLVGSRFQLMKHGRLHATVLPTLDPAHCRMDGHHAAAARIQ